MKEGRQTVTQKVKPMEDYRRGRFGGEMNRALFGGCRRLSKRGGGTGRVKVKEGNKCMVWDIKTRSAKSRREKLGFRQGKGSGDSTSLRGTHSNIKKPAAVMSAKQGQDKMLKEFVQRAI